MKIGNKFGLTFIKTTIKAMNINQLMQLETKILSLDESENKQKMMDILKKEYEKRKIKFY